MSDKSTRKERLIAFNKSNILDAARELFKNNGVEKTTVDEIAKAADCSKATVYVYFKNKEDIYYHIVLEYMTALLNGIKECFSQNGDYESAYFSLCKTLVKFSDEYPMYFEYTLGKISVEPKKIEELPVLGAIYEIGEEVNKASFDYLSRAQNDGFLKSDIDILQTGFVMWSSICGIISMYADKRFYFENLLGFNRDDFFKNSFKLILNMIKNK